MWCLAFLTLSYSTLHRSVHQSLPWCILHFSTPVPYHILPCHLYHRPTLFDTILHHSLKRPVETGSNQPRAETTKGLKDSPWRLNRHTPKSTCQFHRTPKNTRTITKPKCQQCREYWNASKLLVVFNIMITGEPENTAHWASKADLSLNHTA